MAGISEIDAIRTIDDALSQITDSASRDRILRWAWQKYASEPLPGERPDMEDSDAARKPQKRREGKSTARKKRKPKSGPTIVKDLNLRPKGKKPFADFIAEKQPSDNQEKCTVAVYYLKHELDQKTVDANHVFTCYKSATWRVPADLENALSLTAHRKGWLDTSDMKDIKLTTHGENLVEHDLPPKLKSSKK